MFVSNKLCKIVTEKSNTRWFPGLSLLECFGNYLANLYIHSAAIYVT